MYLIDIGKRAKNASKNLANLTSKQKNDILVYCAKALLNSKDEIIKANNIDIENAKKSNTKSAFIDRLKLTNERIEMMAEGILKVANLEDPLNEYIDAKVLENGLKIIKKRVPIGVIGIIYEARPNVTSDAFAMCFKASSSVILKGGKEAINSNKIIIDIFRNTIKSLGYDEDIVILIEKTDRETTMDFMRLNDYVNLLIPRGGAGLINAVVENSTIPVIETGVGNCHIYFDEQASIKKGVDIVVNAKAQRPSVCNALETLLLHKNIAKKVLPKIYDELKKFNVEIRCDSLCKEMLKKEDVIIATEEDWKTEFLDYILAIKIVDNLDDAINHIEKYSTGHSETIITENYENALKFTEMVDSAVVYVNASTRFTDGEQFEMGAEIGISTQKLHARGPMGIKEITSYKYIVLGSGQIRK